MGVDEQGDLDVLALAVQRWRSVAVFALLGFTAASAYSLVATQWYEARLSVVPASPTRETAALALAARIPGLDAVSTDSKRIESVLISESVADEVIKKFKLQDRYGDAHIEETRAELAKHCTTTVDKKSNVVGLLCEDPDPAIARDIAAWFGEVGNRVFGRISTSAARQEEQFLGAQVASARESIADASRALREFQERHKIIDLPEQTKAVISAMASVKGELISKQLTLSYISGFAGSGESSVVQLQQEIAVLDRKLDQLTADSHAEPAPLPSAGSGSSGNFFPGAMTVPGLRFELEQLLRDQKIKETVFALLTQRHEAAKVDAARDTPSFQILDYPTLPTLRSRPVRRKIAMVGGIVGVLLGVGWVVVPVWWRRRFVGVASP
jgi:capsule polysaccharide export protein KpsE/RkpR